VGDPGQRTQIEADTAAQVDNRAADSCEPFGSVSCDPRGAGLLQPGSCEQQPVGVVGLGPGPLPQFRLLAGRGDELGRPLPAQPFSDRQIVCGSCVQQPRLGKKCPCLNGSERQRRITSG
jgi:hypothetical protein